MEYDLSILIPARNEMFLVNTIEDILKNKRGNTQIVVGLDGYWPDPPIKDHQDVVIIHYSESIGQRAITKQCARVAKAKYIAKTDAHCSFDEGFDVSMLNAFKTAGDLATIVPIMRNLHVFNWKCMKCGKQWYQGPTPTKCSNCDNTTDFKRKIIWVGKSNPQSTSYCFDSTPHFQYFKEWTRTPQYQEQLKTGLTETMSLQGSFFMMTKDRYFDLDIDDESMGSWGSQGITVAMKTWLSGGKVLVNHDTWYAHLFRTQGGDFSFPYKNPESKVQEAKKIAREKFLNKDLIPILEKFWPVSGWSEEDLNKLRNS
jgi:hypothetical protein